MLFSLDLYPSLKIQLQHLKNDATPVIYVNSNDVIIIRPYANVKNLWLVPHPINFMYFRQRKDHIINTHSNSGHWEYFVKIHCLECNWPSLTTAYQPDACLKLFFTSQISAFYEIFRMLPDQTILIKVATRDLPNLFVEVSKLQAIEPWDIKMLCLYENQPFVNRW